MSLDVFPFTPEFQLSILQLLTKDTVFLSRCVDLIEVEYFESSVYQWFYKVIRNFFKDHRSLIDPVSLKNEFRKSYDTGKITRQDAKSYIDVYHALWELSGNVSYIKDQVIEFAKYQEFKKTTLQVPDMLDARKYDEILKHFQKAAAIDRMNNNVVGIEYFKDIDKRMNAFNDLTDTTRVIPTGIPHLDAVLKDGGLSPKELGVIMAPPNRGKSNFLISIGKRAVLQRKKVVHYTFEMSEKKVAERYDAAFSGIDTKVIKQCIDSVSALQYSSCPPDFVKKAVSLRDALTRQYNYFDNALIIKEYPTRGASVNTLKSHIESLYSQNFIPDLVILDYADIMKPTSGYNDKWLEQGAIYEEVRGMAVEYNIPIWTGCQANRSSMSKSFITIENIADSFDKAKISDVILALCQTPEEKDENIMRLFVAKNRDAASGQSLIIRPNYQRMKFHCISDADFDGKSTQTVSEYLKDNRKKED